MTVIQGAVQALARLKTTVLGATLLCAAGGACAAAATVAVSGFTVSTSADPSVFVFAPSNLGSQSWDLRAFDGAGGSVNQHIVVGGVPGSGNVDHTAQTSHAKASVSSSLATDPLTQLTTPLFTLAGESAAVVGLLNSAFGSFATSGGFCFWDGASIDLECNAAGEVTLTVYYDLLVDLAASDRPGSVAEAGLELAVSNSGAAATSLTDFASTALAGSRLGQFLTFTLALGAGDVALFDLSAAVSAVSVPEPGSIGLAALGLAGFAAARRRRAAGARAA
jgi:hypothetical protein